jgi:K(+)-stimulated pyrophosphate-energized sodium pump
VIAIVETPEVADVPSMAGVPIGVMTGIAFIVGAACSMASGIIGMFVAVRSNVRTASAARPEPRRGRPGRDARRRRLGLPRRRPVAARRLGIFTAYQTFFGEVTVAQAPFLIVGFGFGASFVALFAPARRRHLHEGRRRRLGPRRQGREGHPEDDPRNAGVVADLVGDNVGDCAGRGADLFESTAPRTSAR